MGVGISLATDAASPPLWMKGCIVADRKVTVRVDLQAGGNLPQAATQAAAQVEKLQRQTKATTAGGPLAASMAQRSADAENRLAYLRSGAGQSAAIRAIQAETALARQREFLGRAAKVGVGQAQFERTMARAEPFTSAAGRLSAGIDAAAYASIAGVSAEASSQITNSFRMISNEIGIMFIPSMTRMTGTLQSVSRGVRNVNEATSGWAGTILTTASVLGIGAWGIGKGISVVGATIGRLRVAGEFVSGIAGSLIGGVAQRGIAGGGGGGGGVATGVGGFSLGSALLNPITAGIVGGVALAGGATYGMHQTEAARAEGRDPGILARGLDLLSGLVPTLGTRAFVRSVYGAEAAAGQAPGTAFANMLPFGLGQTLGFGSEGSGPQDVAEREPRTYRRASELQEAITMRTAAGAGPLAEQEARATQALIEALNQNTAAQQGGGATSWWPTAGENG